MKGSHFLALAGLVLCLAAGAPRLFAQAPLYKPPEFVTSQYVEFQYSREIFNTFLLLNAIGYDEETNRAGMHPVRQQARALGAEVMERYPDFRKKAGRFYRENGRRLQLWQFANYAFSTTGYPEYMMTARTQELRDRLPFLGERSSLGTFADLLREFAQIAPVEQWYRQFAPQHEEVIAADRLAAREQIARLFDYFKPATPPERLPHRIVVLPTLLSAYDRSFSFEVEGTIYVVEGPQKEWRYNPHELLHALVNPLTQAAASRPFLEAAEPIYRAAPEEVSRQYRNVEQFVEECLVKALALHYAIPANSNLAEAAERIRLGEYRLGYILELAFFEGMAAYPKSGKSLAEFYLGLLQSVDLSKALRNWEEYQALLRQTGQTGP
ncbi:MAG TPA: hypothetical protein VIH17_09675 [Candidatus Acidoferrales bacterium]